MNVGLIILLIYIVAVLQMHFRGAVRFSVARQVLTHTNYLAPVNLIMDLCSSLPNKPILKTQHISDLEVLKDNWQPMRDEAIALQKLGEIKAAEGLNDVGFNSFFRSGWTRFYLKWYGADLESAKQQCPKTIEILSKTPSVKAAMFASLPPGAVLNPHRDPYAGSLRYHLGLDTPNSDDCYILVDGRKHVWRNGEDVLFDETFIHEAHNETDKNRIILFCDIRRPMRFVVADKLNSLLSNTIMRASATRNNIDEPVGFINRMFEHLYSARILSRRFKRWNKSLYKTCKYVLFFGLVYLIFF